MDDTRFDKIGLNIGFDHRGEGELWWPLGRWGAPTIRVCRNDGAPLQREADRVDGILVTVKSLDAQPGAGVPQGDRLVARAGADVVREGLERDGVDGIDVASKGLPAPACGDVPQLCRLVHGSAR